jgi:tRNA A22 N-methylase
LGGKLIAAILRRDVPSHPSIKTLIVDPHSERPAAYRALMDLGFRESASVSLVEGGLYYEVSRWEKSLLAVVYDERQLTFGPLPLSMKPAPWRAYWGAEAKRLEGIAVSLPRGRSAKREELLQRARLIEETIE